MNYILKMVGRPSRLRQEHDTPSHSGPDDNLSLMHLRKLCMEFLHSPLSVREQEAKLYSMLPLFCKVFGNKTKPIRITEKFAEVCQFAAHVSRLMVSEIRKRAAHRSQETASKAMMDFLSPDASEEVPQGRMLLEALDILSGEDTPVVECMVAASLPSSMVKCIYLFYALPQPEKTKEKSVEDILEERSAVHKIYGQVLVKLCHHSATARELVHTDDLSSLFTAISCSCVKQNLPWRTCVSEVLMTLTRHGLDKEVVKYIHGKSCISQCMINMRRIQEESPLELVEMLVTFVCCLKDSCEISPLLLADFRSCHGYLFLSDLLLMLGDMKGDEAREACRNVVLLVASIVMIGHVALRPLVSIGAPFQDPQFLVPEPGGKGVSVRNVEAFQVLHTVFLKATDKLLCLNILDCINNIYCSDNANYFILEPQHTLSLFIEKAPEKHDTVQERIFKLLEFVICNLNWVPCPELISVSILFKNKSVCGCHQVALSFLIRILSFDPKYKDIFREVGLLEVLTNCLRNYGVALKEKFDETVKTTTTATTPSAGEPAPPGPGEENLVPDLDKLADYPFLLLGCLRLLLEENSKNSTVFRECGGARCVHNMVPYPSSRTDALKIIRELILNGNSDDLGTLLSFMHSKPQSEVKLKIDVLEALLKVFDLEPRARAVFREVGGFVYVMSVLIGMEGSLAASPAGAWKHAERAAVLRLLRTVFRVLTDAMQDEPANKNFFMDEVRFRGLADTIRLLGCFSLQIPDVRSCSDQLTAKLKFRRQLSTARQRTALSRSDSVRSTVVMEESLDLNSSPVLHAANEMLRNLHDMATDSFKMRSATLNMSDSVQPLVQLNAGVPRVYHAGAIRAFVDLLPAVNEECGADNELDVEATQGSLELQLYWVCELQNLLKSEHNQQIMCEAGLPLQLLQRCALAFADEQHPLHVPLQRIFERLASQALTPTVLRDFLRLGSPLFCQPLEILDGSYEADQTPETKPEDSEEDLTGEMATPDKTRRESVSPLALRKISDAATRRVSVASPKTSEGSPSMQSVKSRASTLTFRDTMLSMMQPSSESGSDSEHETDSECGEQEFDQGFEIVGGEEASGFPVESKIPTTDDTSPSGETVVHKRQRGPGLGKSLSDANLDDGPLLIYEANSGERKALGPTSEVDGVDIDTVGDSKQEVSSIDQGEDLVILDVRGEASARNQAQGGDTPPANGQIDSATTGDTPLGIKLEQIEDASTARRPSADNPLSPPRVAELSVDDLSQRLSLQPAALSESGDESPLERSPSVDSVESSDSEPVAPPQLPLGRPVPLTRVKCLVSMTTPIDARAPGSAQCPAFVEFDMSADGFGCLFLPAVAPQPTAGIASVGSVVAPVVVGAMSGVGTGERVFPPQAGLTFVTWLCVDQYSHPTDDPHPVRLLTLARQFSSGTDHVQSVACLTMSISAKDKMLVVSTEEGGGSADSENAAGQSRREKEHTEARFLSEALLEEGKWHHVMVVLNRAMIRNSTATLFVDGNHVATCKLKYIPGGVSSADPAVAMVAPYVCAFIGTASSHRRCSRLLWRTGATHLLEEPLSGAAASRMYALGPSYVGSFQAPCADGETSLFGGEWVDPLVSEEKVMFGLHAHATSVLTMIKIRKYFRKWDARAIARELGLVVRDSVTPVRLLYNTAAHLLGPSRTIGAVFVGCSGVRNFQPNPVSKLIECIGGMSALLGLVAMATDVEGLYASVKALTCILRNNPSARLDMARIRGYQILALLLRRKRHMLNTHILHLTFALVGTVDSSRESSFIPNKMAFKDLLCDLEVWREAPADLQRSLFSHFLELLGPGSESQKNAELMQRMGLVSKLLYVLQDRTVTDATAHTVASVLSVLLSNTDAKNNLKRFGQFMVSTLPAGLVNEKDVSLDAPWTSDGSADEAVSPRVVSLRNVMLELILCLIYGESGQLDNSFGEALQETLGFDWLLLFTQAHLHRSTVLRAARILVTMLGSPAALAKFKEGSGNGGWLDGTQAMLHKASYVVAGFNVGPVAESPKYQINKAVCCIPGFLALCSLLPRHVDIPEMYHLVIALLLGHPVSDVYAGALFDWDSLYSVFWSSSASGVKVPVPTGPQDPGSYSISCPEAALVLLAMARTMVNDAWYDTGEGSWLREYPVTLVQFLVFLYRNVPDFKTVCIGQEFLEKLVSILFLKKRSLARFQKVGSDSENEEEAGEQPSVTSNSPQTSLIAHPARKFIVEFLRIIVTDAVTCNFAGKGSAVLDTVLEAFPANCSQPQQAEYQTELLCAQIDYFLGGNLLANPSAGPGNHAKIVTNAFTFASRVVDKLWIGNFTEGYKVVFNFILSMIEAVRGQAVSLDGIYHSLNRAILFQLSRPLARLTDQTSLLEFLHILTTHHKVVFSAANNDAEFVAGLCHWLLVMGVQRTASTAETHSDDDDAEDVDSTDVGEEVREDSESDVAHDEDSSCTRLLAAAAERVWDIFVQNKREAIEEACKVTLPKPSFTSYSPKDYADFMPMGANPSMNLDLKAVRSIIEDPAARVWMNFISSEEKQKADMLGHQRPQTRRLTARLTSRKASSKKEKREQESLVKQSPRWTLEHTAVVRDLVRLQHKNHLQNYQLISKSVAEEWALMDADLTRERGLWGPPFGSRLDKWTMDMVEGPHRMRKKMCRNNMFYVHYSYDPKPDKTNKEKRTKYKPPISLDSKTYYQLRGKVPQGVGPIEGIIQQQGNGGEKLLPTEGAVPSEPSEVTEANEGSEVDNNQTIVKLLEAGEKVRSMYRCARVQGLDTAEGLFLIGQQHFYVVDGVTLLSTKEIKDIDSLPPGTHDPIIPQSSHEKPRSCTMERMCSKWAYQDIREVHKRRYLLQETAIEVFSSDGRNHFLVFPKSVRDKVLEKLISLATTLRERGEESVVGMKRDTDVESGVGLINTIMGERSVTQRWERGEITNFQYLMHLNTLAGRSYNDLMQYPVFPWVLADYESEELDLNRPEAFRDFSKPMGAQSQDRLALFQRRYREWDDPTGETPPYHYGTHYSSAMIVASYLIRMEPFAQHFLRLQGGHFDLPDRLFHSVRDAWLSAGVQTNMADVKELIPEFFYLPEFLCNSNNFDLGIKQNGDQLGDVVLPSWAKGDPREFIRLHRKALECDFVSAHLHEWIDLIFGYKQQGPAAFEANNVFHYLFYEGNVDIHGIDDPLKKSATIGFINNFGQIPKQLFKRPHPPKKVFRSAEADVQVGTMLLNADRLFFHNLPCLVPSAQPVKELRLPVGQIIQSDKGLLAVGRNKVLVPPFYNRYISWGFGDLSMRTGLYETDKVLAVYENFHLTQVLCAVCPDSRTLITGGTSTLVCVWDMVKSAARKPQLVLHEVLYGHHASVTCLAVSTSYNLIVSGSEDQTCIIWDLNKLTYVRQLPGHAAPITAIAINNLTGDIATCAGTFLYVWSVNGQLVVKENTSLQTAYPIQCCTMSELSEWDEENVILTGSQDGIVRMWGIEFHNAAEKSRRVSKIQATRSESSTSQEEPSDSKTKDTRHEQDAGRQGGEGVSGASPSKVTPVIKVVSPPSEHTEQNVQSTADSKAEMTSRLVNENEASATSLPEEGKEAAVTSLPEEGKEAAVTLPSDEPEASVTSHEVDGSETPLPKDDNEAGAKSLLVGESEAGGVQAGGPDGATGETGERPKLVAETSKDSAIDDYVIIDSRDEASGGGKAPQTSGTESSAEQQQHKPEWKRRLVLRHQLTMHTAHSRKDNMSPASVSALLISRDHRKLFVGDTRGRIYSWSVSDGAGRMADHWIKDEGAKTCSACEVKFTFSERRHHCRDCGKVFCNRCSKFESEISRLKIYNPVRVCLKCYTKLKEEQGKT